MTHWSARLWAILLALVMAFGMTACAPSEETAPSAPSAETTSDDAQSAPSADAVTLPETADIFDAAQVPGYTGAAYTVVHDNLPYFAAKDVTTKAYEFYSDLDGYGRCGVATACVGQELMPTEERSSIGQIKPSGWQTVKYDSVDGKYLYNRCHLIGYQLSGENANSANLITGTRSLNMEGMLPFENMVADYIKETGNHVLYRVTPIFSGANLVASGVLMEGYSVEDQGAGICYCVYAYNVQPGITIDYATGASQLTESASALPAGEAPSQSASTDASRPIDYVLNDNTMKFHAPSCRSVGQMKNPITVTDSRDHLMAQGYEPCGICKP